MISSHEQAGASSRGARRAVIRGLGAALPAKVVTNDDLSRVHDTSDEWIQRRTGIRERRHAADGEQTSDLAILAARRALESAGAERAELVVLATTTPDKVCPATAPKVAAVLGLAGVPAFDVSAVCSGFLYALATAAWAIESGSIQSALVIGAETFTRLLDPVDRTTAVIFGDGAGAVHLESGSEAEPGAVLMTRLYADGTDEELIHVPQPDDGAQGSYFQMNGREVFTKAVEAMSASVDSVLGEIGWRRDEVDALIAHQANLRILTAVAHIAGLEAADAEIHLDRVGNTSAASIPLAMAAAAAAGRRRPGDRVVLTAFGGGTTWGAAALTWPELAVIDPH
ncbi:beta-ketoacyl-ACP synthase III [Sinomonas sp. ASV322]|uniref:beta-ketoacyl-ACP synthase III n=1 Tax=Sinomonas sp. ASV322 TaxID=3041920 RepID=UPI0027DBA20B|nr:beta-ketoacyl-ACP synthase III [Sinomonas sp. ASV322]MDQ4504031.1 beta-ketoacyl-ACP synthase III [Sinomonas sp. ASV322]